MLPIRTNIIETNIAPPPNNYEAYLYRYTNMSNKKTYVGIHKGSVDDAYNHSSKNKEFEKVFANSKSKLIFEVLMYGDYLEMQNKEFNILKKADVRNNPAFYNKAPGFPQYAEPDRDKCIAFDKQIDDGIYPVKKEDLEIHLKMAYLQVRYQHDTNLQQIIKQKIDDANGITDDCNPVLVWEGRGPNGEDIRGDGSHTVFGAGQSKHAVDISVMRIPYEIHCDLTDDELRVIGNYRNKRSEIVKKSVNEADGIKHVLAMVSRKVPYNANSIVQILRDFGFTGGLGKGEIKKIIDKAKQIIDVQEERDSAGRLFINYKASPHNNILKAKVASFNLENKSTKKGKPNGQCSAYYSSLAMRFDRVMETLYANNKDCNRIMVVIYHPTAEASVKWKTNGQPAWLNIIESSGMKWKVDFYEMDMWMDDISKQDAA